MNEFIAIENNLWDMLDNFEHISNAMVGLKVEKGSYLLKIQDFASKITLHLYSVIYLLKGTPFKKNFLTKKRAIDVNSIFVINRAIIETYLVFYYIYRMSKDENERKFKHLVWDYSDLHNLINSEYKKDNLSELDKKIKTNLLKRYDKLNKLIVGNDFFKKLTKDKKDNILKKGMSRFDISWNGIAEHVGFHKDKFKSIYNILCSHAHSGNYAITQVKVQGEIKNRILFESLFFITIVFAIFIVDYCQMTVEANNALEKNDFLMYVMSKLIQKATDANIIIKDNFVKN